LSPRRVTEQEIGAVAGLLTPVLAFTCILTAIASYPAFSWTSNALSDLGVAPGLTGPLFNFGLCASGFLGFNFTVFGLFTYFRKSLFGKTGALIFAAAAVALIAVGVFNESFKGTHFAASVAFFVLGPLSMFIMTSAFLLGHQRRMAIFTLLIATVAALPWILLFAFHYVEGVAIPETIWGLAVSAWIITLCYVMAKQSRAAT
jgi:hypothetical membrane protein